MVRYMSDILTVVGSASDILTLWLGLRVIF